MNPVLAGKSSSLSLSPQQLGGEGQGEGAPDRNLSISPLTCILSPQGERNIVEAYFLSNMTTDVIPHDVG